jgi:hypothetical protein
MITSIRSLTPLNVDAEKHIQCTVYVIKYKCYLPKQFMEEKTQCYTWVTSGSTWVIPGLPLVQHGITLGFSSIKCE